MLQFFARTDLESRPTGLRWAGGEDDQTEVHETIRCNGCGVRAWMTNAPAILPIASHDGTRRDATQVAPVVGNCYKCDTCLDYHLCQTCFQGKAHNPDHTFKLWHTKKRRLIKRYPPHRPLPHSIRGSSRHDTTQAHAPVNVVS